MTIQACLTVDCDDYTPINGDSLLQAGVQAAYPSMLMHAPEVKGASPLMERNEIIQHAGTYEEPRSNPVNAIEVTVIGGGLAGMAASIHLSRAGLRVLCIEPDVEHHHTAARPAIPCPSHQ